jgi:mannan endo-1,4-beta-mannosidase
MAWEIGNEPRAFSEEGKAPFARWLAEATALIRSMDGRHLITIGNEGVMGSENDAALYEAIHADPNVDYLTIHIWPKNWRWIDTADMGRSLASAIEKTNRYIDAHLEMAERLHKPLIIEEFGFPRDHHLYTLEDSTNLRDKYYENIFGRVAQSSRHNGLLGGCNFWAWGGLGRATHLYWQPWDDYLGDPSQEEQGLNAVFDTDSTVELIRRYAGELGKIRLLIGSYSEGDTEGI